MLTIQPGGWESTEPRAEPAVPSRTGGWIRPATRSLARGVLSSHCQPLRGLHWLARTRPSGGALCDVALVSSRRLRNAARLVDCPGGLRVSHCCLRGCRLLGSTNHWRGECGACCGTARRGGRFARAGGFLGRAARGWVAAGARAEQRLECDGRRPKGHRDRLRVHWRYEGPVRQRRSATLPRCLRQPARGGRSRARRGTSGCLGDDRRRSVARRAGRTLHLRRFCEAAPGFLAACTCSRSWKTG
jgi:hypothetical protein